VLQQGLITLLPLEEEVLAADHLRQPEVLVVILFLVLLPRLAVVAGLHTLAMAPMEDLAAVLAQAVAPAALATLHL
jgi:hypothetical protein